MANLPPLSHNTLVDWIMTFEGGDEDLTDQQVVEFFQFLIDTGLAWQFQGMYGRTAMDLVQQGLCRL